MKRVCDVCNAENATKLCSICRQARYCNVKCQRRDWKSHKFVCKSLKNFDNDVDLNVKGGIPEVDDQHYYVILQMMRYGTQEFVEYLEKTYYPSNDEEKCSKLRLHLTEHARQLYTICRVPKTIEDLKNITLSALKVKMKLSKESVTVVYQGKVLEPFPIDPKKHLNVYWLKNAERPVTDLSAKEAIEKVLRGEKTHNGKPIHGCENYA